MIGFSDFKLLYVCSVVALGLIILSPTLALVVRVPGGERFSELWILGPGHMAEDYPFNVSDGGVYKVFLGIGNRMGGLEDYLVYVKFRNQTEFLPDSVNGTPSVLKPVFEYRAVLSDSQIWEREVSFSFKSISFVGNSCRVSGLVVDGSVLSVDKVVSWNQTYRGFPCQLFLELWRHNTTVSGFQYHNRFVGLWFNLTAAM